MRIVRVLALAAVLCGAAAAQDDASSPSPPTTAASTVTATATTSATTAPSETTPAPTATTAAPASSTASSSPPAATITVNAGFTDFELSSACVDGKFVTTGSQFSVSCTSTYTSPATDQTAQIRVLLNNSTERLQVGALNSNTVTHLEIDSYEPTRQTQVVISTSAFDNLTALSALSFSNIDFYKPLVSLPVPATLAYLKLNETNAKDVVLTSEVGEFGLSEVDFSGNDFATLPLILYQFKYAAALKVNSNMSFSNSSTALSAAEYANAQFNVAASMASVLKFEDSCEASTTSVTDPSDGLHTVCMDSTRTGIRTLGTNNFASSSSNSTTPTPSPTTRGSSSNTTLTVVVIVIAIVAAVLAYFVARRYFCKSGSSSRSPRLNERTVGLISKDESHAQNKLSFISSDDALRQIRLEQQEVSITKSVGTGRLWVGDYSGRKVMIKRIEAESSDSYATKALISQARSIATLSHPNIVGLVGVTWVQGTDFGVVGEFMEKGTLKSVLMDLDSEFDLQSKLHMCLDIAQALMFLHSTEVNMYMRHLTSRKVLVNGAIECKLNLFECHPCTNKIEFPEVFGAGNLAWEAPELITRTGVLDPRKINIFSLGVLICEIMTRVSPYQSAVDAVGNTLADLELAKRVRRQERLIPHENRREFTELPTLLRDMVERCLSYQPLLRPSAEEVVQCLESVKDYSERIGSTTSL